MFSGVFTSNLTSYVTLHASTLWLVLLEFGLGQKALKYIVIVFPKDDI